MIKLKGDIFVRRRFPVLESPTLGLYEFNAVGDDLEDAPGLSVILMPLVLVENADHGDTGSLVEIGRCHFCELSEAADLDPVCDLLFGGRVEGDVEMGHRQSLRREMGRRIISEIPCQDALIERGCSPYLCVFLLIFLKLPIY